MQIKPCVVGPGQSQTLKNLSRTATNCPFATEGPFSPGNACSRCLSSRQRQSKSAVTPLAQLQVAIYTVTQSKGLSSILFPGRCFTCVGPLRGLVQTHTD